MTSSGEKPEFGGQLGLGFRPEIAQDLFVRNSFSKAVRPEYHGLWVEDYADITKEQLAGVNTQMLHDSLIGTVRRERLPSGELSKPLVTKDTKNAVFYQDPETRKGFWIAVTPFEHTQLAGNIEILGNRVTSRIMASRLPRRDFVPDREAAVRGGVHAVEDKLEKLEAYKNNSLQKQLGALRWLQHSSENPGKAWKGGIDVRMSMETVRGGLFKDMITAMAEAGEWTPEKVAEVERIIDYRLFFDRKQNAHIGNWKRMMLLADVYMGYKFALYNDKIAKAKRYIQQNEVPA